MDAPGGAAVLVLGELLNARPDRRVVRGVGLRGEPAVAEPGRALERPMEGADLVLGDRAVAAERRGARDVGAGRYPERRMRLLDGTVAERHVVERVELPVVGDRGLGPQALQD